MTTVLKEATNLAGSSLEERQRIVRLAENYNQYNLYELIARIHEHGVSFTKLNDSETEYDEDGDPVRQPAKNYHLTAEEADAFVEAWTLYKVDRDVALEAEELRKAGALLEAHGLAEQLHLTIESEPWGEDIRYHIKHAQRYIDRAYCYGPDGLLELVQNFQEQIREEHKTIQEAEEIAGEISNLCGDTISIKPAKPDSGYYNLAISGRFSHCSNTNILAAWVLNRLEGILRDLEREQAHSIQSEIS